MFFFELDGTWLSLPIVLLSFPQHLSSKQNILVFDLGGGTFDVTLLTIDNGVFEVLATSGDTHLGGEDFDQRLMEFFAKLFKRKYDKDAVKDKKAMGKLRREAEKASASYLRRRRCA